MHRPHHRFLILAQCSALSCFWAGAANADNNLTKGAGANAQKIAGTKDPAQGKDSIPVYSPDHKHFAFVRASGKQVDSGKGDASADIIYYGDSASKTSAPLFAAGATVKTKDNLGEIPLGDIDQLTFSDDGRKLFFLIACYATSDALIVLDLQTHQLKYVTDANGLAAVRSGKHKGYLFITQHRYHTEKEGYGSYEKPAYIKQ